MPEREPFVAGLVLAAGGSTRLGQPKQLLPFGSATLLDHNRAALQQLQHRPQRHDHLDTAGSQR